MSGKLKRPLNNLNPAPLLSNSQAVDQDRIPARPAMAHNDLLRNPRWTVTMPTTVIVACHLVPLHPRLANLLFWTSAKSNIIAKKVPAGQKGIKEKTTGHGASQKNGN